jgi:hypothetical protein
MMMVIDADVAMVVDDCVMDVDGWRRRKEDGQETRISRPLHR